MVLSIDATGGIFFFFLGGFRAVPDTTGDVGQMVMILTGRQRWVNAPPPPPLMVDDGPIVSSNDTLLFFFF